MAYYYNFWIILSPFSLLLILTTLDPIWSTHYVPSSSEKVSVGVYYETLCPDSADFIVNHLSKIFENGLIDIVNLHLSPWGNARLTPNTTFHCQHGPWECLLNTIEACAIYTWPDLKDHFPFIYCVEKLVDEDMYAEWETCFEELNLDPKPVTECYSSGYGHKLELQYAAETNALQPPHKGVPWVVVDGQPLYDEYEYFINFICNAYKGSNVPPACLELSYVPISSPKEVANPTHTLCYREENENEKSMLSKMSSAITSWIRQVGMAASM